MESHRSPTQQMFSVSEVADILGFKYKFCYELVRSGELPAVKIGTVWRVHRRDVDTLMAHGTAASTEATR